MSFKINLNYFYMAIILLSDLTELLKKIPFYLFRAFFNTPLIDLINKFYHQSASLLLKRMGLI